VAVGPLICFAAYIGLLQPHSDDMSRVVDQLLKLIATFIGLSRLSRSGIICCINVFTSLLRLVIVSHWSPRGLGRFTRPLCHPRTLETNRRKRGERSTPPPFLAFPGRSVSAEHSGSPGDGEELARVGNRDHELASVRNCSPEQLGCRGSACRRGQSFNAGDTW
jgi:hypothetical protein